MAAPIWTRRQSLSLLAAGLALPPAARAADASAKRQVDRTLPEAEFTPDDGRTELLGMEDMLRRMTAPVMINGMGPFDFVVDTGTNRSVISDTLAATLNLPPGAGVHLHGISGQHDVATVKLQRMEVGVRAANNLSMAVLPAKSMRGAGILGVDGLKNQRVVLDLLRARLLIEPSSKADTADGETIKTRRKFGQLTVVDTNLSGIQVSVLVDTGSEVTVGNSALRQALDTRRHTAGQVLQRVTLEGATGDVAYGDYGGLPLFRIGALRVANMRLVYSDLHPFTLWELEDKPAILLGMDVIRFFDRVAIDFGRNEMRFTLPVQPFFDPAGDTFRN